MMAKKNSGATERLFHAAKNGDCVALIVALRLGANPMARASDGSGRTALMEAAERGHLECVKALLDLSDLDARAVSGANAAEMAEDAGRIRCARVIRESALFLVPPKLHA